MAKGLCSRCNKPLNGAHKAYCRACAAAYARENRAKRGEQAREYSRTYTKAWHEDNPGKRAEYHRKTLYGMSSDEFNLLYESQDGQCAVCQVEVVVGGRGADKLAVDHDHKTGRVRGILCQRCNSLLGYALDDVVVLSNAISYLERARLAQQAEAVTLKMTSSGFDSPVGHEPVHMLLTNESTPT